MKALGWALIIVGGGLVVLGSRKLLTTRTSRDPHATEELAYNQQGEYGPDEWEQHLLDVEERERRAHDLNDGV